MTLMMSSRVTSCEKASRNGGSRCQPRSRRSTRGQAARTVPTRCAKPPPSLCAHTIADTSRRRAAKGRLTSRAITSTTTRSSRRRRRTSTKAHSTTLTSLTTLRIASAVSRDQQTSRIRACLTIRRRAGPSYTALQTTSWAPQSKRSREAASTSISYLFRQGKYHADFQQS